MPSEGGGLPVEGDRSGRLDRAIAEYLDAADRGQPIPRDRWLADHPDIADELVASLDDIHAFRSLLPLSDLDDDASAASPEAMTEFSPSTMVDPRGSVDPADRVRPGARVRYFGDYKLTQVLGRGGMGIVFLARQMSLDRPVALKMIRNDDPDDEDARRRFRHEAEYIAGLDHPNILTILEVGEHDGCRYFTMPWIDRGSLADQLSRYRDDPGRAARLIAVVADAIDHAHRRGILHRDLKPANILIDSSGRPHVADFGLAKRDAPGFSETVTGAILGTPSFMAPEQAGGRSRAVTTATDVYGLGASLYALLTGQAPFLGKSSVEVLRHVVDDQPTSPRQLNPQVDRALAAICLKCLEKEPTRRYHTARAVADDLNRWIEGRPVVARTIGPLGRTWLWCRRHPVPAGLAAALTVSCVVGVGGILVNWADAREQERQLIASNKETSRHRDAADGINKFLIGLMVRSTPMGVASRETTVGELLDRAVPTISIHFGGHPDREVIIRRVVAEAFRATGRYADALQQMEICRRLHSLHKFPDPGELHDALFSHAAILHGMERPREALEPASQSLEGRTRLLGWLNPTTLDSAILVASIQHELHQSVPAEELVDQVLRHAEPILGSNHRTTLAAINLRATIHRETGRPTDAERGFRRVHDAYLAGDRADHLGFLLAVNNLAGSLIDLGRVADAEELLAPIRDGAEKVLGRDHRQTLAILNNLAAVRHRSNQLVEAGTLYAQIVERCQAALGPQDPLTIRVKLSLLANLAARGEFSEVRRIGPGVVPHLDVVAPAGGRPLAEQQVNLAGILLGAGMFFEAETLTDLALGLYAREPSDQIDSTRNFLMANARHLKSQAILGMGPTRAVEAEKLAELVLAARNAAEPIEPIRVAQTKGVLGEAFLLQARYPESERHLRESFEALRRLDARPATQRLAAERLGRLLRATDRSTEADRIDPRPVEPHRP